jgi:hypothetical protein
MNTAATKRIALATLCAPALTALAIGLAGTASAESPSPISAQDTISQFKDQGYQVVVNKDGTAPLDQCSVIASRQDRRQHHGGPQRNQYITVYVDAYCPANA